MQQYLDVVSDSVSTAHTASRSSVIKVPSLRKNQTEQRDISSKPESLVIHVYGGSVSKGAGTFKIYHEFLKDFLEDIHSDVTILNLARGATGVGPWVDCGLETEPKPDIIISEFGLNEVNHDLLRDWYHMASRQANQVVVLDIWSWLIPPENKCNRQFNLCHTYKVVMEEHSNVNSPDIRLYDNFSILSMVQRELYYRKGLVPEFFDLDNVSDRGKIGDECFEANAINPPTSESTAAFKKCSNWFANMMQHGNVNYHRHHGIVLLFEHFKKIVLPQWERSKGRNTTKLPHDENDKSQSASCYGEWGGGIPSTMKKWDDVIMNQTGYEIGNPWSSDVAKSTLHTNLTDSVLVLDKPGNYGASDNITRNETVKIGFVGHSDPAEVVAYRLNNQSFTTKIGGRNQIRVQSQFEFTGELLYG